MSSRDSTAALSSGDAHALIETARRALSLAVRSRALLDVDPDSVPPALRAIRASFVTLERRGDLLGCIGSIVADRSLVEDVAKNAHGAVLHDPRCPILRPSEVEDIEIHISILSTPEPMTFASEDDLVRQLRPGIDGVILEEGPRRGTFLPVVWETLPDPQDFVTHLKLKAGLAPNHWSVSIRAYRYTTEVVPSNRSSP